MENPIFIFAFTLSLADKEPQDYEETKEALVLWLNRKCVDWLFQLEGTWPQDGYMNPHFQGYFKLKERARAATLKNTIKDVLPNIHFTPASNSGIDALKDYSMKTDTRMEGPWGKREIYLGEDLYEPNQWHKWQKDLWAVISKPPPQLGNEARKVIWIYDPVGGKGKSTLCKYVLYHKLGMYATYATTANLMNLVIKNDPQRIYMIDIPRTKPQHASMNDLYSAAEYLKTGIILNEKYETGWRVQKKAHVVIFSNFMPDMKTLSADRWRIVQISRQDQQENRIPLLPELHLEDEPSSEARTEASSSAMDLDEGMLTDSQLSQLHPSF